MRKKVLSVVLCAAMVAGSLAFTGCGKSSKHKKGEITFMFWDNMDTSQDLMTKGYKEAIDKFNKDNEGQYSVKVEYTTNDTHYTKLNAALGGSSAPDVFICDPGPKLNGYIENGQAADITADIDDEWKGTFSEGIFDRLSKDGKIYAVPTNYASACLFYNKDIFAKYEINPDEVKTWDQFMDACKKIKDGGDVPISVAEANGSTWCLGMLAGYIFDREGVDVDKINSGEAKWTDDNCKKAAEKLKELSQYFQETAKEDTNETTTTMFSSGKSAMLVQGSWAIAQINGENEGMKDKYGVLQFPIAKEGDTTANLVSKTDNLVMSANTKEKDAVIAFMKAITGEDTQKYTSETAGKMPVACQGSVDFSVAPSQLSDVKTIADGISTGNGKMIGFYNESTKSSEIGDAFNDNMVLIATDGADIDTALKAIQEKHDAEQ